MSESESSDYNVDQEDYEQGMRVKRLIWGVLREWEGILDWGYVVEFSWGEYGWDGKEV